MAAITEMFLDLAAGTFEKTEVPLRLCPFLGRLTTLNPTSSRNTVFFFHTCLQEPEVLSVLVSFSKCSSAISFFWDSRNIYKTVREVFQRSVNCSN